MTACAGDATFFATISGKQNDSDVSLATQKNRGACENMRAVAFDRADSGECVQ